MIGSLQWVISFGGIAIQTATMTMSRFRIARKNCHLERQGECMDICDD
jgi:hypothetical protein